MVPGLHVSGVIVPEAPSVDAAALIASSAVVTSIAAGRMWRRVSVARRIILSSRSTRQVTRAARDAAADQCRSGRPYDLGVLDAASCALWPTFLGVARAPARLRTTAGSQG